MSGSDALDLIDGSRYSVDELRLAALEGSGSLSRALALALLRTKSYPEKVADLERLLLDEHEVPRLRNLAAQLLGDMATPKAFRALERGAKSVDELTLRGIVRGLAKARSRGGDALLRKLTAQGGAVGDFAARVAARGVPEASAEPQTPGLAVREKRAAQPIWGSVRVKPVSAREAGAAFKALAETSSALRRPARRGGAILECEGPPWMFVPTEELTSSVRAVLKGPRLVGLLLRYVDVEAVGWRPRFEIATEPIAIDTFKVAVTTVGRARPFLVGTGRVEGKRASFTVESVPVGGGFQIHIHGTYDGRRLIFDDARVARNRWPAREPRPAS